MLDTASPRHLQDVCDLTLSAFFTYARFLRLRRSAMNGLQVFGITAATADVPVHAQDNISLRWLGSFFQQRDCPDDHARRAIAALEPLGIEERLLHWMQMAVRAQTINGSDFAIRCAECGNQATMYRLTI